MADNFEQFSEQEQQALKTFANSLADVSKMMMNRVEQLKDSLRESDAKKFSEIWEQQDAEKKVDELKQTINKLNKTMKSL